MAKIDIVSGFLGAGKTTLIKKLLKEALNDTKVVLIENEFGEIGVDGGFLKEAGIEIKEMNSGCICCSLVGDFDLSLREVLETYAPDRVLIEPSGVGKLSDVMSAVEKVNGVALNSAVAVVDASKCKMYLKNFGEFYVDQVRHAGTIILSRTGKMTEEKVAKSVEMIRQYNEKAVIITTPWEQLDGMDILNTVEGAKDLEAELMKQVAKARAHHEHDEACDCHNHEEHHHEHGEACDCHDHGEHHHEHGEACGCHNHEEHHHDHGEACTCGCHNHDGHGHHHADEVFTSWGFETPASYARADIEYILGQLEEEKLYGMVLRAKGMLPSNDGSWIYFDYVPGEMEIRSGRPDVTGRVCVIGAQLKEEELKKLFADR